MGFLSMKNIIKKKSGLLPDCLSLGNFVIYYSDNEANS